MPMLLTPFALVLIIMATGIFFFYPSAWHFAAINGLILLLIIMDYSLAPGKKT